MHFKCSLTRGLSEAEGFLSSLWNLFLQATASRKMLLWEAKCYWGIYFLCTLVLFKCHKELAKPNYYQLCRVLLQLTSVIYCFLSGGGLVPGPFLRQGASGSPAVGGSSPQLFSLTAWWKPKTSPETQSSFTQEAAEQNMDNKDFSQPRTAGFSGKEKQFLKHSFT